VCAALTLLALATWLTNFDTPALVRASQVAEPLLWGIGAGIATRTFVPRRGPLPALFLGFLVVLLALGRTRLP
jgi:hypothetical protein